MTQWIRTLGVPPDDLYLILSAHMVTKVSGHTVPVPSSERCMAHRQRVGKHPYG